MDALLSLFFSKNKGYGLKVLGAQKGIKQIQNFNLARFKTATPNPCLILVYAKDSLFVCFRQVQSHLLISTQYLLEQLCKCFDHIRTIFLFNLANITLIIVGRPKPDEKSTGSCSFQTRIFEQ